MDFYHLLKILVQHETKVPKIMSNHKYSQKLINNNKYSQKLIDSAKKYTTDAIKSALKEQFQKLHKQIVI